MRTLIVSSALLFSAMTLPPAVLAQTTRSDTEFVGQAVVLKQCVISLPSATSGDLAQQPESAALALAGGAFLAGVAGDLTSAGINAIGAALEEASREKGFSATGSASFPYYRITQQSGEVAGVPSVALESLLKETSSICLVLSYRQAASKAGSVTRTELGAEPGDIIENWKNYRLSPSPDLYVEAELQKREDGFVVRPVLVWYRQALPHAPTRALATELHTIFSTPAAPTAETSNGTNFAIARIRLPDLKPGDLLKADALTRYASLAVPARPISGSPQDTLARLNDVITASLASMKSVTELERSLQAAEAAAKAPGASAETKGKVAPLQLQLAIAQDAARIAAARLQALKNAKFPVAVGTTNVQTRFTVVRDANKFGLALANSLKTRSAALGQAVTTSLTPTAPGPSWTAADTNYVTAMTGVESAQRALDVALAGGDAAAIFEKQIALKNAKAAANAAAAASNRPLPFPGLI